MYVVDQHCLVVPTAMTAGDQLSPFEDEVSSNSEFLVHGQQPAKFSSIPVLPDLIELKSSSVNNSIQAPPSAPAHANLSHLLEYHFNRLRNRLISDLRFQLERLQSGNSGNARVDRIDNEDGGDWEDTTDNEDEDEDSVGESSEDEYYNNNRLCFVVSNGKIITLKSACTKEQRSEQHQCLDPTTPAWKLVPILESLQKREHLPFPEELIQCTLEPPAPEIPPGLGLLVESLTLNNLENVYRTLELPPAFTNARIGTRSEGIAACLPAFTKRVTLYKQRPRTDAFPVGEIIIESLRRFSDGRILVVSASKNKVNRMRTTLWQMGISMNTVHTLPHGPGCTSRSRDLPTLSARADQQASGISSARIYLCAANDIPASVAELSRVRAETIIVYGADRIDEAFLLTILPNTSTRLVLFGEAEFVDRFWRPEMVGYVQNSTDMSLWGRLVTGGLPCVTVPTTVLEGPSKRGQQTNEPSPFSPKFQSFKFGVPFSLVDKNTNGGTGDGNVPNLESIDAWRTLDQMVGLEDIKVQVRLLHHRAMDNLSRREKGQPTRSIPPTGVLLGPPGTGKSTVARLYADILHRLGFVKKRTVKEVKASQLVESVDPLSELDKAKGRVVIIDDAQGLWGGSETGTYSEHRAAINALVACVPNEDTPDRIILLVGYEDEMVEMLRHVNPGLARRFPLASAFRFPGFSISQLEQLLEKRLQVTSIPYSPHARSAALAVLRHAMMSPQFGNASEVDTLLHKALFSLDKRCMDDPQSATLVLEPEDFSTDWNRVSDAEAVCERLFQDMVGCESVISELLEDTRVARKAAARNLDPHDYISFNYVFKGPPGTGKTTTARKMGQVFYSMGLLASAEVIECSVSNLIGEYIGHTGPKILNLFNKALGKVLFVDEAYRLYDRAGSGGSFSADAVAEIIGALTSPRFQQKMVIILAGYSEGMDRLLDSNPGLRSRFTRTMTFPSLDATRCIQLLLQLMQNQGLDIAMLRMFEKHPSEDLTNLFAALVRCNGWGNARDIHTLSGYIFRMVLLNTDDANEPLVATMDHLESSIGKMITSRGGRLPVKVRSKPVIVPPPGWNGREWLERRGYK
ncbi:P-loop containing nucleoside triphosphate hydrolase protein [Penicillium robsamsonii]|uniref:P-loop containing nucleoside triphosphate hydrolase protein n=1 Tax=Penicillium robsamsonii TaxID=1792511 RepID=UPI0025492F8B|nr:P-loop containing nucleoside triphosphate hydrolase protein [Penicillium robsamsonii]KAJ5827330.1 P-loop containing nucleoside triphosphate hydrolase protein [Penicillium robsamsonii]